MRLLLSPQTDNASQESRPTQRTERSEASQSSCILASPTEAAASGRSSAPRRAVRRVLVPAATGVRSRLSSQQELATSVHTAEQLASADEHTARCDRAH